MIHAEAWTEEDKCILKDYPWSSYKKSGPVTQRLLELAVLKAITRCCGNPAEDTSLLDKKGLVSLVHGNDDFRSLLLRCWEMGSFRELRNHGSFRSLTQPKLKEQPPCSEDPPLLPLPVNSTEHEHTNDKSYPSNAAMEGHTSAADEYCRNAAKVNQRTTLDESSKHEIPDGSAKRQKGDAKFNVRRKQSMVPPTAGEGYRDIVSSFNDSSCHIHDSFNKEYVIQLQIFKSENHESKIPEWLSPLEYSGTHNDIRRKRTDKTGAWFIQSQSFRELCTNPYRQILWCPGIPGVGKTVIASLAIDHLRGSEQTAVVFIYFNYRLQDQQNLIATVQSLSRQLHEICRATQSPSAFEDLYISHMKHKSRPSVDELKRAFDKTSQQFKHVYIVLDALDEYLKDYQDHDIQQLLETVTALGNGIKVLITTRVIGQMESLFENVGAIRKEIRADRLDLETYIQAGMATLRRFEISESLHRQVMDKVQEAANGRFLMAELHMNSLVRHLTAGDLRDALKLLPDEIDQTYAMAVERIEALGGSLQELAMKVLMWITRCRRPMLLGELQHALAMKEGRTDIGDYLPSPSTITSACAGLVVIEGDKVGFVHLTAQEFFNSHQARYFTRPDQEIALTCLSYLVLPYFRNLAIQNLTSACKISSIKQMYPFYDYASINWGFHANATGFEDTFANTTISILEEHSSTLHLSLAFILRTIHKDKDKEYDNKDEDRLLDRNGTCLFLSLFHEQAHALSAFISKIPAESIPITRRGVSPYLLAAHLGQTKHIQCMLTQWCASSLDGGAKEYDDASSAVVNITTPDHNGDTALLAAARRGHGEVVELILQCNISQIARNSDVPVGPADQGSNSPIRHARVDINSQDKKGMTALLHAARYGHVSVVEVLLRQPEIDVILANSSGQIPLMLAAQSGHDSVMQLLLGHSATEINMRDNKGFAALLYAASNGHHTTVTMLFKHPYINVELPDKDGMTPLMAAAAKGHASVVKLFLERDGIHVNAQNNEGCTPLIVAAELGHSSTIQLLLKHPATEVNLQDDNGDTALSRAAFNGHDSAVRLLLNRSDVNIDLPDKDGWTPLMTAAGEGHTSVIKLFLERDGMQVNARNNGGRTTLMIAAELGHSSTMQLLLKHPATEVNLQDDNGDTALSRAAFNGHDSAVRLLLNRSDVNIDLPDKDGWTPLMAAVGEGYTSVIKLFLERDGVQVNARHKDNRTPLIVAAQFGHDLAVHLLAEHLATDVNLQADSGWTALHYAASNGHVKTVKLLLDHSDINIDIPDKAGWTPLMAAAGEGHTSVIKLFLERDCIQVNARHKDNRTPLIVAAQCGHALTVQLLLEHLDIDPNLQSNLGRTAIFFAALNGHDSVVGVLLNYPGTDIELPDKNGGTPLMAAAAKGHASVVKLFLEQDVIQVNARHNDCRTPLIVAAQLGHASAVRLLLEHSATDVNLRDNNGWTALCYAAWKGYEDVVKLLLKHGEIEVDARDNHGCTPLSITAEYDHESIVHMLLDHGGVNANNVDDDGDTPLICAAYNGRTSIAKLLLEQPGIEVNIRDNRGRRTALSRACDEPKTPFCSDESKTKTESEAFGVVQLLLARGDVDINLADENGHTPLYYATQSGFTGIVELLESEGAIIGQVIGDTMTVDISP